MKSILLPTYDFDGNVLKPQTSSYFKDVQTGKVVEVPAHEVDQNPHIYYDTTKYEFPHHDAQFAFQNFRDFYPHDTHPGPNGLIEDTKEAIRNDLFAPSFHNFKKLALIEANLFAILTARGHGSDNIQRSIELISQETLTADEKKQQSDNIYQKYYKIIKEQNISNSKITEWFFSDIPSYIWVSNKNYCKHMLIPWLESSDAKKVMAIKHHYKRAYDFYQKLHPRAKTLHFAKWFSDDSVKNIIAMTEYYLQEIQKNKDIYRLYFTGEMSHLDELKNTIQNLPHWNQTTFHKNNDIVKISIHK